MKRRTPGCSYRAAYLPRSLLSLREKTGEGNPGAWSVFVFTLRAPKRRRCCLCLRGFWNNAWPGLCTKAVQLPLCCGCREPSVNVLLPMDLWNLKPYVSCFRQSCWAVTTFWKAIKQRWMDFCCIHGWPQSPLDKRALDRNETHSLPFHASCIAAPYMGTVLVRNSVYGCDQSPSWWNFMQVEGFLLLSQLLLIVLFLN